MAIVRSNFTGADGRSYPQIELAQQSDWSQFDRIARILETELPGAWSDRQSRPDRRRRCTPAPSRYWTGHYVERADAEPERLSC
jgi:hypothetical protein